LGNRQAWNDTFIADAQFVAMNRDWMTLALGVIICLILELSGSTGSVYQVQVLSTEK